MLSQGVIDEAKQMGDKLDVGSSQTRLQCDNNDEALLELLKGNTIERFCSPQRVLVPRIAEPIAAPMLAVVRFLSESRCRKA